MTKLVEHGAEHKKTWANAHRTESMSLFDVFCFFFIARSKLNMQTYVKYSCGLLVWVLVKLKKKVFYAKQRQHTQKERTLTRKRDRKNSSYGNNKNKTHHHTTKNSNERNAADSWISVERREKNTTGKEHGNPYTDTNWLSFVRHGTNTHTHAHAHELKLIFVCRNKLFFSCVCAPKQDM